MIGFFLLSNNCDCQVIVCFGLCVLNLVYFVCEFSEVDSVK